MKLFPFIPDWDTEPKVTWVWQTSVKTALDQSETRLSRAARSRLKFEFEVFATTQEEAERLQLWLNNVDASEPVLMPLWPERFFLTASAPTGSVDLAVDDDPAPYLLNRTPMVMWKNYRNCEEVQLQNITGTVLTVTAVAGDYAMGDSLVPALVGYLHLAQKATLLTDELLRVSISFEETLTPPFIPPPPVFPTLSYCGVQSQWTATNNLPYENTGDNTTGFVLAFGDADLEPSAGILTADFGNGWHATPARAGGDFRLTVEARATGPYTDLYLFFTDVALERGFGFRASPSDTDTPESGIYSCCFWNVPGHYPAYDGQGFYAPIILVQDPTADLVSGEWATLVLERVGSVFTFKINSQVFTYDSGGSHLTGVIGLGYYLGGVGSASFRNLTIINL